MKKTCLKFWKKSSSEKKIIVKAKNRAETAEKMVVTLEETIDELEGKI